MRFSRDLYGSDPILRDLRCYNSSDTGIAAGAVVAGSAVDASEGTDGVINATVTTCIDIAGVTNEAPSALSVQATGTEKFCKTIVNPFATYLAEYDTTNGGTNTSTSASGEVVTCTISANATGDWFYCYGPTTDTALGNLIKAGSVSTTASATNVTGAAYDDELGASTTSSTYIHIVRPLCAGVTLGSVDLLTGAAKIDAKMNPTGAAIMVVENYINSRRFAFEPLTTANHCGKKDSTAKFYGELLFVDNLWNTNTLP